MQCLTQTQVLHRTAEQIHQCNVFGRPGTGRAHRHRHIAHAERKFNEGAAEVKRLLNRDRSSVPDLDKPAAFDTDGVVTDDEARTSSENGSQQPVEKTRGPLSEPFPLPGKSQLAKPVPFGGGALESPLSGQSPFRSAPSTRKPFQEPSGLSPDMEISPISDVPWWRSITLTQVVIALSFLLSIGLMVATFWVVWKLGAIRLNE